MNKQERIADDLRAEIAQRTLPPGSRLPSEPELMKAYGVSRSPVRDAVAQLAREGLVVSESGRGWLVREYAPLRWQLATFESRRKHEASGEAGLDAWSTEVRRQDREPNETIDLSMVRPPDRVAERLSVPGDVMVVLRSRVRYVDGTPYQTADSYFREDVVRGTPLMEPHSVAALGGVLAATGHPQQRYLDEIFVRMPTRAEATRLDLPTGTPIAEVIRTGYAADGTPLRCMISIAPGDRNVLVYELDAD